MKKTLLPLLLIVLLTSFTGPILNMVNVSNANSTPTIDGVEPAEPKQLPYGYRQWLSILGSGFTRESSVNLSIGTFNKRIPPERTEYISPNKIYVLVGLTDAGTWKAVVENPGGLLSDSYSFEVKPAKTLATIDEHLLDLIDQYASDYFRDIWNITLDQYKAWIATIAWGEGRLGGYVAHSQGELGSDVFDHKNETVKEKFRFSTGIGPFQIDRGGEPDNWHNWPTIKKLNYTEALNTTLRWHNRTFYGWTDATLENFSSATRWNAVTPGEVEQNWKEVTGTNWIDHKNGENEDLKWDEIKKDLKTKYPSYDENVERVGEVKWDLTFVTSGGKQVSFKSYYPTWLIKARNGYGLKLFEYYYTYDDGLGYEIWVWNNAGKDDEFRHVFVRNYTKDYPKGALPENYTSGDKSAGFTTSKPALNPNLIRGNYPFVPIDLVFVLDRSGSMGTSMGTKTRIQGAKDAAIAVINALMPQDRVAVVSFSTTAMTNVQLTNNFEQAKNEIQKISAGGWTSFGAGLSLAVEELKARGSHEHVPAIIFLSDGWHNTAPEPDPYVLECKNLNIPIYTVGLGTYPSDVNEALLRWMAKETGGKYLFAPELFELQNIFLRFSLEVSGWTPEAEFSGIVYEGQTVIAGTFDVAPFTAFMRVTLNWPGSDLDLVIERPDGSEVELGTGLDNIYSGATAKPEWVVLLNPQAGTWTVKVYGKVINSPDEPFIVWVSTYVPPAPQDTTPPITTLTIGSPQYIDGLGNTYVASATPFKLNATDNSGVAETAYKILNSTYETEWMTYTTPFYLAGLSDGNYTIAYNSTDNAGNIEPTKTATVILDNTPPSTTLIIGEPKYVSDTTYVTSETPFTLEATDNGSGVFAIVYRICNATFCSDWTTYNTSFFLTSFADGSYTIEYYSIDNVQNVETTHTVNITLFSWNYVFEDTHGRETILKINLAHKFFQFITPDKDYGIRNATSLRLCGKTIRIKHYDNELKLISTGIPKLDFCIAIAWNTQTRTRYFLIDKVGTE